MILDPNEWDFRQYKPGHRCNSAEALGCLFYEYARELPSLRKAVSECHAAKASVDLLKRASEKRGRTARLPDARYLPALRSHTAALKRLQHLALDQRCPLAVLSVDEFPNTPWRSLFGPSRRGPEVAAAVMKFEQHDPCVARLFKAGNKFVHLPLIVVINPSRGRKEIESAVADGLRQVFDELGIEKQTRCESAYVRLRNLGLMRLRCELGPREAVRIAQDACIAPCDQSDWFRRRGRVLAAARAMFALPADENPNCCNW